MLIHNLVATGSAIVSGSSTITGDLTVLGSINGSIGNAVSASYASTSSFADDFTVAGTLTAQKIVVQTVTSSVVYSSGSNVFGNNISNIQSFTGSVNITGSLTATGIATFDSNVVAANSYNLSTDGVYQWTNGGNKVQMSATNGTWTLSTGVLSYNPSITVTSTGNVGIGTTTVSSITDQRVLQLNAVKYANILASSGTVQANLVANSVSGWGALSTESNHPLILATNGTEKMRITSGGNVLIGTTTDAGYKLDVNGIGRFSDTISTTNGTVNNLLSYTVTDGVIGTQSNHGVVIRTNNLNRLTIATTGDATFSNSVISNVDMRAPIFYDSNNTSYYVDPASTSNIVSMTMAGTLNLTSAYPYIQLIDTASTTKAAYIQYGVTLGGNGAGGGGYLLNYSQDRPFGWTVGGIQGVMTIDTSGNVQALSSHRAPIFYDSNNTSYYIDPASTSNLVRLDLNTGDGEIIISPTGWRSTDRAAIKIRSKANTPAEIDLRRTESGREPGWHFSARGSTEGGALNLYKFDQNNSGVADTSSFVIRYVFNTNGSFVAAGDMRAPIFYDSDNTAYYVDPASTSNLVGLTVANTISGNISGNAATSTTATSSPLLSALSNYTWTVSTLPTSYNLGIQSSFVGPNAGEGSWQNYGSVMTMRTYSGGGGSLQMYVPYGPSNGGDTLQVRFGDYSVNSGNSWTAWKFLLHSGNFGAYTPTLTGGGAAGTWGINITGAAGSVPFNSISEKTGGTGAYSTSGDFRAPIFYDLNNTGYYLDPSSTGDSIRVAGDIVAYYSDERLKDIKENIPNAINKVLSLNGFYYEPNEIAQKLGYKKKLEIGLSAQEVERILPEIIKDAPIGHGYKTLDYGKLTPLLVEAIKEQQQQIEELKTLINNLTK